MTSVRVVVFCADGHIDPSDGHASRRRVRCGTREWSAWSAASPHFITGKIFPQAAFWRYDTVSISAVDLRAAMRNAGCHDLPLTAVLLLRVALEGDPGCSVLWERRCACPH